MGLGERMKCAMTGKVYTKDMEKAMFDLKFSSKQMARLATKAEKDMKAEEKVSNSKSKHNYLHMLSYVM